eukprot:scpid104669/ scgid29814/ 
MMQKSSLIARYYFVSDLYLDIWYDCGVSCPPTMRSEWKHRWSPPVRDASRLCTEAITTVQVASSCFASGWDEDENTWYIYLKTSFSTAALSHTRCLLLNTAPTNNQGKRG